MYTRFLLCLIALALCHSGSAAYAVDTSFTDEQIKAAAQAQENQAQEERDKESAPWHFILDVKSSHRGFGHAGNSAVIEGVMDKVFKHPTSESALKSEKLNFSFYCGNTFPDAPVDPCKPYLGASRLEIWGKFSLGSEGEPMPDSLIVLGIEPQ